MAGLVRRPERGATTVEFALLTIPFMVLVLGIIQYGYYFWTAETTNSSSRETARRIVVGDCWNTTDRTGFTRSHAPTMTSVTVTPAPGAGSYVLGDEVKVAVTADANILGFFPLPDGGVVTRDYAARVERITQSAAADDECVPY